MELALAEFADYPWHLAKYPDSDLDGLSGDRKTC